MGCFSTCFRKSNQRKFHRRQSSIKARSPPRLGQVLQVNDEVEVVQIIRASSIEEKITVDDDEQLRADDEIEESKGKLNVSGRKKVTFDLNLKIYEGVPNQDDAANLPVAGNGKEDVAAAAAKDSQCSSDSSSSSSSLFSYPPHNNNYRYQNCGESEDEMGSEEESDMDDYSSDDDEEEEEDGDAMVVKSNQKSNTNNGPNVSAKEELSESSSLFSLSLDSRKHKPSSGDKDKEEVNSPMPIKIKELSSLEQHIDSVLNPVENLTQWKAVKARSKLVSKHQQQQQQDAKENMMMMMMMMVGTIDQDPIQPIAEDSDPNHHLKPSPLQKEMKRREVAVDTSLSSWLGGSECTTTTTTPNGGRKTDSVSIGNSPSSGAAAAASSFSSSPVSFEDRPILGALTVEELKEFSAKNSPRRSPSPSPDDVPIIGTVGSYWSHTRDQRCSSYSAAFGSPKTNPNVKTKSREVPRTPFAQRLERASQAAAATAQT